MATCEAADNRLGANVPTGNVDTLTEFGAAAVAFGALPPAGDPVRW